MKCKSCGNSEFTAHQTIHAEVIVNERGLFLRNRLDSLEASVYYAGNPFGPFTCTVCGAEYDELSSEDAQNSEVRP